MSDETARIIGGLNPAFAHFAVRFVNAARAAGLPLVLISGRRSGPVADPDGNVALDSWHIHGLAVDAQVVGYLRGQVPPQVWQALGAYWESMGGRWGGRFRTPDLNHFDSGGHDA